jgi:hypothetical protein
MGPQIDVEVHCAGRRLFGLEKHRDGRRIGRRTRHLCRIHLAGGAQFPEGPDP